MWWLLNERMEFARSGEWNSQFYIQHSDFVFLYHEPRPSVIYFQVKTM